MTRAAFALLLLCAGLTRADDPELIPFKPVTPQLAPQPVPIESMSFMRQSMYDRWQYYSVDRTGHFRPRVVLNFPEPFYLVNGRPYPLMSVRPNDYIPYVFD
jgi:hypothetical protein